MVDHTCSQSDRILTLELNQKSMAQDISEIKKDVKEINSKFDELIEKLDQKYAAKNSVDRLWIIVR
jgi:predicted  nucleic acid-binding Zn-ribbon protein